jgi:hypothetical protein
MKYRWLFLMVVMLFVTACGIDVPLEPGGDTSPLVQPTSPISLPPTPPLQRETITSIVEDVRPRVSEQLRINPEALTLVSEERVMWRDASLGCPQEGKAYAQVLVPGWRIVFVDAAGQEYDVHAAENPETYVICQQQTDAQPKPPPPFEAQGNAAVEAAKKLLAERLEVNADAVSVVEVESVEWRNSCLGCAAPGQMCLMVITPGYRVVVSAGDISYEVHTDRTGQRAIFCAEPALSPRVDK